MTKVLCEQCGKHIANIIDGDFVEIENWGMSESEQELCAECCKKEDQRELELEAAQCIWEAVLVSLGSDDNIEDQMCKSIGTVELRYQLRQRDILKACIDGWDLFEKKGVQEKMIPCDWEYVPWFTSNCLDWDTALGFVSLKKNWKEVIENHNDKGKN